MAYYDRRDIPFQYELAETFTLCDAYHCSLIGPTNPNRLFMWSGTVGFEADGRRVVGNDAYDEDNHPGYTWTSYPERLERAGVSWQTYQEMDNFQDNGVEFFASFKAIARRTLSRVDGGFRSLDSFYVALSKADSAAQQRMLAALAAGVAALPAAERRLYDRGLRRVPPGQLAASFRADVDAGQLPRVSYLVPSAVDSEHPSASSPSASAVLIYDILDALARNPEVWSRSVLLINFDEFDGYFDHVPPPVPPASATDEFFDGKPLGSASGCR